MENKLKMLAISNLLLKKQNKTRNKTLKKFAGRIMRIWK